jgi:hypothetical protein
MAADKPTDSVVATLAGQPIDDIDHRTLRRLAGVLTRHDPVPDGMIERMKFALTLNELHAEVAELQRSEGLAASVRGNEVVGPSAAQTITFSSESLTVTVSIGNVGVDRVRIDGWVAPGENIEVEVKLPDGTYRTTTDSAGRFVFESVPRGAACFVLHPPAGSSQLPVVTRSMEL